MAGLRDYKLESLIGRGSMGPVYRARLRAGGAVVALKKVRWGGEDQAIDRLQWEATAISSLDHPYILKLLEVIADEEGLAIVMDLVDGGSLGHVLDLQCRLPPEEAAALAGRAADALGAVHALGIIHADVKPSNILLGGVGNRLATPLLSDFGLSRWIGAAWTRDGAALGTAEYLDPDVAAGASPSPASDLYSLGIVCYQILAGRVPYRGATPSATLRAADRGNAEPLARAAPTVPSGLAAIVERAMSRRPESRPPTAAAVADALRAEIAGHWPSARRSDPVAPVGSQLGEAGGGAAEPRLIRSRRRSSDGGPELPAPPRRPRAPAMIGSVVTVLVVALVTAWVTSHGSGALPSKGPCRARPSAVTPLPGPGTSAVTFLTDVAGGDCPVSVVWSSGVITVSFTSGRVPVRFALGEPGDELLLGDWDCRRGARPALYRPSTGQVFYFAAWAELGRDLAPSFDDSTATSNGVPRVVRDGASGCDRVEVARPRSPSQ